MFFGNPGNRPAPKAGYLTYSLVSKRLSGRLCAMLLNGTFRTCRDGLESVMRSKADIRQVLLTYSCYKAGETLGPCANNNAHFLVRHRTLMSLVKR